MAKVEQAEKRISISEASRLLDRSPATIRAWDRNESMPPELRPFRDKNNNRYWTLDLIAEIKFWIVENNFYPGNALHGYEPTPEEVIQHVTGIRETMQRIARSMSVEDQFAHVVKTAMNELGHDESTILAKTPEVIEQFPGLSLDDALHIAAGVFAKRR